MVTRSVDLVKQLRDIVRECSEFCVRGSVAGGSVRVAGYVVAGLDRDTREFREHLEALATFFFAESVDAFWNAGRDADEALIRRRVKGVLTTGGYERFRDLLAACEGAATGLVGVRESVARAYAVFGGGKEQDVYLGELGRYLEEIHAKVREIGREVNAEMGRTAGHRELTGTWGVKAQLEELRRCV